MPAPETQQPQFEQIQMGASPATPTTEQPVSMIFYVLVFCHRQILESS